MNYVSGSVAYRQRKRRNRKTVVLIQKITILVCLFLLAIMSIMQIGKKISKLLNTDYSHTNQVNIQEDSAYTMLHDTSDLPWYLTLVNADNPINDDYNLSLTTLRNNHAIDSRCYPELQSMMDDCRAAGLFPVICSSYRTNEKQRDLFNQQIQEYLDQGYTQSEAQKLAATSVAKPGTSEHELGLAVDIVDESAQLLNDEQENTDVQRWLMQNSWRYGFILRYPSGKTDITGIQYEPWHYRFVGLEAAKEIYENNWTLEEYINQIELD